MHRTTNRRRAVPLALAAVTLVAAALAGSARADAASSYTQILHDFTSTSYQPEPCSAVASMLTTTVNAEISVTLLPDGTYHEAVAEEGTATFVPLDPSEPTYTGHFTQSDQLEGNQGALVQSLAVHLTTTGSDGSSENFILVQHITLTTAGVGISFVDALCEP